MKIGSIKNADLLNSWELIMTPAEKLPQDLATAVSKLFGAKLGGSYIPVYYVATQVVNGKNHKLIFERTKLVSGGNSIKDFAVVTINIPAGGTKAEKARIVSEQDATDFVLRDEIEIGYKKAMAGYVGANHKPLIELGEQMVKGINYHFICESKLIYPDSEAYLTRIVVNNYQEHWTIVEIERI